LYEPRDGVEIFLKELSKDFNIIIHTTREVSSVSRWLDENELGEYITEITNTKPRAVVYLDDRAVNFNGSYLKALEDIYKFKTYWEKLNDGE
jgi:hypothetical protein